MRQSNIVTRMLAGAFSLLAAGICQAVPYYVSIDTSSLGAVTVGAAIDFVDGGTPSNSVVISNFATNGTLGAPTTTGGVTGSLPSGITLDDSSFFNEYYQLISSPTSISFDFEASANAPDSGSLPDTFAFFLIDDSTGLPFFDTTDPTGAGALFIVEIDGTSVGVQSVYGPADTDVTVRWTVAEAKSVPEPSTLLLLGIGLLAAAGLKLQRRCAI